MQHRNCKYQFYILGIGGTLSWRQTRARSSCWRAWSRCRRVWPRNQTSKLSFRWNVEIIHVRFRNLLKCGWQVVLELRYGREDEELMGLQFCNEMILATRTVFPATEPAASAQSSPSMSTGICSQVNKKISVFCTVVCSTDLFTQCFKVFNWVNVTKRTIYSLSLLKVLNREKLTSTFRMKKVKKSPRSVEKQRTWLKDWAVIFLLLK